MVDVCFMDKEVNMFIWLVLNGVIIDRKIFDLIEIMVKILKIRLV